MSAKKHNRKNKRLTYEANERLSIRCPEELHSALFALASDDARTLSSYVVKVLTDHVKAHYKPPPPDPDPKERLN